MHRALKQLSVRSNMEEPNRIPYPPCYSAGCADPKCCAEGYKFQWPELVGTDGEYALRVIEKENPLATAFLISHDAVVTQDFCCNRVRIFLDQNRKVHKPPMVG